MLILLPGFGLGRGRRRAVPVSVATHAAAEIAGRAGCEEEYR